MTSRDLQTNPNLPSETIGLRSFNLIPGATFMLIDEPDPRVWVAALVARDVDRERVYVWAHAANLPNDDSNFERAFSLDFNTLVALVGLVVNPSDLDDNDWGN